MNTFKPCLVTTGLLGLTIFSGLVLASPSIFADDSVDNVSITVPVSCSLSGTGMNTHTTEIANGTYTEDIGTTTIKAFCNDSNGFAIYAIGFTGDQYSGEDHIKLIGANNSQKIATGLATSGDVSNWAMKLGTVSSPTPTYPITIDNSFNNYHVVPDTYTKVAHRDSSTDIGTNAEGSTLTTTYAAYISRTQVADTYSGKVKYTFVHPASEEPLQPQVTASGQICYYANASDAVGTMGCQSVQSPIILLASNFSREGYGFVGWSDVFDYETNPNAHFYGPQETISFNTSDYRSPNNGLSLYAVWIKSVGSLQDSSKVSQLCGTGTGSLTMATANSVANLSSVSALTDSRDGQVYAIAKLADGKCWMIENLRLENTNSDNSTGSLAQGYGTAWPSSYDAFAGLANPESTNFSYSTAANSLYYSGTQSGTATVNIGTSNYPAYRMPRYNNSNTTARASSPNNNITAMYSYGNYYTWHAAIADLEPNGSLGETSICPLGWHLPTGSSSNGISNNELWALIVTGLNGNVPPANYPAKSYPYYDGSSEESQPIAERLRSYPNNFVESGYFGSSAASRRGGYYWSSIADSNENSFRLFMDNSMVYPGTGSGTKYHGYTIRCLADV